MVLILDDSSEHVAHIWSKSRISIGLRHSFTSTESSNPKIISEKTYLTTYVRNMFLATILYKYHGTYMYIKSIHYSIYLAKSIIRHLTMNMAISKTDERPPANNNFFLYYVF